MSRSKRTAIRRQKIAANGFYLTIAIRDAQCQNGKGTADRCRAVIPRGGLLVYKHKARQMFCKPCADRIGLRYRVTQAVQQRGGEAVANRNKHT